MNEPCSIRDNRIGILIAKLQLGIYYMGKRSAVGQLGQLSLSSFWGR